MHAKVLYNHFVYSLKYSTFTISQYVNNWVKHEDCVAYLRLSAISRNLGSTLSASVIYIVIF